jgi:hypothetical protein
MNFKSRGLNEKHTVATWNVGICLQTEENQGNLRYMRASKYRQRIRFKRTRENKRTLGVGHTNLKIWYVMFGLGTYQRTV